jgi:hypothetical protein
VEGLRAWRLSAKSAWVNPVLGDITPCAHVCKI